MQRSSLFALFAVLASISSLNCSKNNSQPNGTGGTEVNQPNINPGEEKNSGPKWLLNFTSRCGDGVGPTDCVGYYGISVDQDGHFTVGPGPTGELRSGEIKSEDLQSLRSLLKSTLWGESDTGTGMTLLSAEDHVTVETAFASEDVVTFTGAASQETKLLRTSAENLYFTLKSGDQAKTLYAGIRKLAETYYAPIPFPDACEDGINALQVLSTTVKACKQDSDCGYFDSMLNPVQANAQAFLEADNCARVLPLSVANIESLRENKSKIIDSWRQVVQACGEKIMRADCTQRTGFSLNNVGAVCQQGTCQAPSSLVLTAGTPASFL